MTVIIPFSLEHSTKLQQNKVTHEWSVCVYVCVQHSIWWRAGITTHMEKRETFVFVLWNEMRRLFMSRNQGKKLTVTSTFPQLPKNLALPQPFSKSKFYCSILESHILLNIVWLLPSQVFVRFQRDTFLALSSFYTIINLIIQIKV